MVYGMIRGALLVAAAMAAATRVNATEVVASFPIEEAGEVLACPSKDEALEVISNGFSEDPFENTCSLVSTDLFASVPVLLEEVRVDFFVDGEEVVDEHDYLLETGIYEIRVEGFVVVAVWPYIVDPELTDGESPLIERGLLTGVAYDLWIEPQGSPEILTAGQRVTEDLLPEDLAEIDTRMKGVAQ